MTADPRAAPSPEPPRLRTPAKVLFFLAATPAVLRAAWRLHRRRRQRIDTLAPELRRTGRLRWAYLRRPGYLAATAERWLPFLPTRSYGRCLRRSLLLLDLWSRCGLDPTLHLGTTAGASITPGGAGEGGDLEGGAAGAEPGAAGRRFHADRRFHAWVTTGPAGPRTSADGHEEIWRG